ncbi:hypothetical protein [Mycobacterium bourgelatii]|nr:hypothetical protein [Mycobacterium bourgelatii]
MDSPIVLFGENPAAVGFTFAELGTTVHPLTTCEKITPRADDWH